MDLKIPENICKMANHTEIQPLRSTHDGSNTQSRFRVNGSNYHHNQVMADVNDSHIVSTATDLESSTIVITEDMTACMVVNLSGDMVMQSSDVVTHPQNMVVPCNTSTSGPFAVGEQCLVSEGYTISTQPREAIAIGSSSQDHNKLSSSISEGVALQSLSGCMLGSENSGKQSVRNKNDLKGSKSDLKEEQIDSDFVLKDKYSRNNDSNMVLVQAPKWKARDTAKTYNNILGFMPSDEDNQDFYDDLSETEDGRPKRKSAQRARKVWRFTHDIEDIGRTNGTKRQKRKSLLQRTCLNKNKEVFEEKINTNYQVTELPIWAKFLSSVRIMDGAWVVGIARSHSMLSQVLEAHSRMVLCDYIKSHPNNFKKRHSRKSQESRLMWRHQRIEFDGVPFAILSSNELKCIFGMKYKRKEKESKEDQEDQEHNNEEDVECSEEVLKAAKEEKEVKFSKTLYSKPLRNRRYKDVVYTGCPAKIVFKEINKYPGYAVPRDAKGKECKMMMSKLRHDMNCSGVTMAVEEMYHIILPLVSLHNHPMTGRARNIHPTVVSKIRELVGQGITAPRIIKKHLDNHVASEHLTDPVTPQHNDRAFYPHLRDISNIVYAQCKRLGIPTRKKGGEDLSDDSTLRKKKKLKKMHITEEGKEEDQSETNLVSIETAPIQASTLQEAVQTFCGGDMEDRSELGLGGGECAQADSGNSEETSGDPLREQQEAEALCNIIRGQLEQIKSITYNATQVTALRELYRSLQNVLEQSQHLLPQDSAVQDAATTTNYIIEESVVGGQDIPVPATEQLVISEQDSTHEDFSGSSKGRGHRATLNKNLVRPFDVGATVMTTEHHPVTSSVAVAQVHGVPQIASGPHQVVPHLTPATPAGSTLQPVCGTGQEPQHQLVHYTQPQYLYYIQEVSDAVQAWTYTTS
ncbi:uncharacterized protein LOC143025388 [Oratosquilla oratoria]|uniref:uncharacterized protein LOC143025388 n=1 Tax=Oratosquilla oratoria TaxID=337810 RepID=UPI003F774900